MATHHEHYRRCGQRTKGHRGGSLFCRGDLSMFANVYARVCVCVCLCARERECECGKSLTESHRTGTWEEWKGKRFQDKDSNLSEVLSRYLFCHYVIQSIFKK